MAITNRSLTRLAQQPQLLFIVAIVVFYLSLSAQIVSAENTTFAYIGIKSGMTKDEIRKHLDLDAITASQRGRYPSMYRDKTNDEMVQRILEGGLFNSDSKQLSGKAIDNLKFYFTDQANLWRLDVIFVKPSDPPKTIALENALKERFKGYTMKEESSTSEYGTSYIYRIIMIDNNILTPSVQRYTDDYLKKM